MKDKKCKVNIFHTLRKDTSDNITRKDPTVIEDSTIFEGSEEACQNFIKVKAIEFMLENLESNLNVGIDLSKNSVTCTLMSEWDAQIDSFEHIEYSIRHW